MFKKALVTGGGGFLGQAIIRQLREQGVLVRSLSRGRYDILESMGVEQVQGDLGRAEDVLRASEGCEAIFHVAAKVGVWGEYEDFFRTNVEGTRNILQACQTHGIRHLIYTSSPSVIFDGKDMEGVDESVPYPQHADAFYPSTKALAEQEVLKANSDTLRTVALRPHLIWGPGDPHLAPRLLKRAKQGRLRRIGDRDPLVDTVYVENAADAHILAAKSLLGDGAAAGKAYFITNDEPIGAWTMIDKILAAGGLPPLKKKISAKAAYRLGAILEGVYRFLRIKSEPPMTRFVAKELSTAHWFDISAAKRDLHYQPKVSIEEGLQHLAASLKS
ncbi:MAG: NAD-dependent epimerase/dehydratase family protein [Myxococcales bacterium]|nr:NAD-dependent epimerase/dehydratase family protein [Myxococcales bacterium]